MAKELSKTDFILRSLKKISHKKWELFIVSRIVHNIDSSIEFVCQQLVRLPDGTRALTDIYFPQFNIHLEIDEKYHSNNVDSDVRRSEDIVFVTGHNIERIRTYDRRGESRHIEAVASETDAFIQRLLSIKKQSVEEGTFIPWDWNFEFSSIRWLDKGFLDASYNPVFRSQVEALRCFGFTGKSLQRGIWRIPDGTSDLVWFPRLWRYGNWHNKLSADGNHIYECAICPAGEESIEDQLQDAKANPNRKTIVFAKAKDSLGRNLLRYIGTFKLNLKASSKECIVFDFVRSREPVRCDY